jgi:phosphopantothenoylcysteine decarboxylase/phosphopantothenate--cysteine ligase
MTKLLITAGPTREYIDPVRFLSNASSGRMGYALAESAVRRGHSVMLVSGPVEIEPPKGAELVRVETTSEMYDVCLARYDSVDAVFAAAAVCDYRPLRRSAVKLKKDGAVLNLELTETEDILAEMGRRKSRQVLIGFALESDHGHANALRKLKAKNCDAIVLNAPTAIGSDRNDITLMGPAGEVLASLSAQKTQLAEDLMDWLEATMKSNAAPKS